MALPFWRVAFWVSIGIVLLPLDVQSPLADLVFTSWNPAKQLYLLIKPGVIWAALGFVIGMAGQGAIARGVALAGVLAGLIVGLMGLLGLQVGSQPPTFAMLIELAAVVPGLALGLWLGERSSNGMSAAPLVPQADKVEGQVSVVRRGIALVPLIVVGWTLWGFPIWRIELGIGFILYFALLMRFPHAWLLVLPAALPLLDLAFWSGRFFFDEFDMLVLVTFAAWLWRGEMRSDSMTWPMPAWLLLVSVIASTAMALYPWPGIDANSFSSYWSQWNGLRIAKGILWGMFLFLMGRGVFCSNFRLFAVGMVIGVVGVSLAALWESWLFTGFGTATDYRVTATFSSLHTGGGHIEAYLALAIPFIWYLLTDKINVLHRIVLAAVFLLAGYAIVVTVARGGVVAFVVASMVLAWATLIIWRRKQGDHAVGRMRGSLSVLGVGAVLVILGVGSGLFFQQRVAQTAADAMTRYDHWKKTVDLLPDSPTAWLLGAGLGSFPHHYLFEHPEQDLGSYAVRQASGNSYLALNSGGTLYMAQAVSISPRTPYVIEMDVRSDGKSKVIELSLCEKKLFNSHRCQWGGSAIEPTRGEWQHVKWSFNSGDVGSGNWLTQRPVQLSLYNSGARTFIDIDNVQLIDRQGNNLLANGDFRNGLDRWFFKTGDHLPWHAKNLWIHLFFEQGLLGVLIFCSLFIFAVLNLGRAVIQQADTIAATLLAGISALLVMSVVDSLVDAPRLGLLMVLLLLFGSYKEEL